MKTNLSKKQCMELAEREGISDCTTGTLFTFDLLSVEYIKNKIKILQRSAQQYENRAGVHKQFWKGYLEALDDITKYLELEKEAKPLE